MTKLITSWFFFAVGTMIVVGVTIFVGACVVENFRCRQGVLSPWNPFRVPDFMSLSIKWCWGWKSNAFFTDTKAFLVGSLGIALVLIAIGFHFRHLYRQDVGMSKMKVGGCHSDGLDEASAATAPVHPVWSKKSTGVEN